MKRIMCVVTGLFAAAFVVAAGPAFAKTDCGLNTGKAATGAPIPIGAVTSITGIATFHEADQGAEAYFKCVNANGGIHGRPIVYHEEDDQTKLDIAAQAAKKLVVDEGVYLMVGSTSLIECIANADQYLKAGVLEIGLGIPPQCYQSKNIAEINAGPRASALGALDYARRKLGAKSLVCLIFKFPGSDYTCGGAEDWGKHFHVKVNSIYADPMSPDFGSLALQVLATGDEAVQALFVDDQAAQLLNAAQQQDGAAKMKWTGPTSFYTARFPGAIDTKYWNDRLWVNTELGPLEATGKDNSNWNAVMDAYGPKVLKDSFSQAGYIAARIAVDAMLTIKDPAKINRATVTAAVEVMKPYHTDILCGPWYWGGPGATEHQGNHVTRTVVIHNGGFKFVEGCFPVADPGYAKSIVATEEKLGINKKFNEEYKALK
jgi:branched-chain amino acid transport system substrate-binding protein